MAILSNPISEHLKIDQTEEQHHWSSALFQNRLKLTKIYISDIDVRYVIELRRKKKNIFQTGYNEMQGAGRSDTCGALPNFFSSNNLIANML